MANNKKYSNFINKRFEDFSKKRSEKLLSGMMNGKDPSRMPYYFLLLFCSIICLLNIGLLVLGISLIVKQEPNPISIIIGITMCLFSILMLPFRIFSKKNVYTEKDFPKLFSAINKISTFVSSSKIKYIRLNYDYNTLVSAPLFSKSKILDIGLPLFLGLTENAQKAMLINKISTIKYTGNFQSLIIFAAFNFFSLWIDLYPEAKDINNREIFDDARFFLIILLFPINFIAKMILRLMLSLIWYRYQRNTYLADKDAILATDFYSISDLLDTAGQINLFANYVDERKWDDSDSLLNFSANLQQYIQEQLELVPKRRETGLNAFHSTHPPIKYRLEYCRKISNSIRNQALKLDLNCFSELEAYLPIIAKNFKHKYYLQEGIFI